MKISSFWLNRILSGRRERVDPCFIALILSDPTVPQVGAGNPRLLGNMIGPMGPLAGVLILHVKLETIRTSTVGLNRLGG